MKLAAVAMCGLMALSACTMSSGPQLGPDGRPLPRVYKLRPADLEKVQANMQEGINTLRAARGAVPLQPNQQLFMAATAHSADMSRQNRPWHFGSDGSSPLLRAQRAGYQGRFLGELVSETFETELETLAAWSADPDSRSVLLDPTATEFGFSWYQEDSGKIWWTLVTGNGSMAPIARVGLTALGATVSSEMDGIAGQ